MTRRYPRGYTTPLSPDGTAGLVLAPPWHYSADFLVVEYRTDPDGVIALLPKELEPAADAGSVAAIFADWQVCSDDGHELVDPVQGQYKEFFLVVGCTFRAAPASRCVFIWVDKDFAMLRGIHQGYPKKLGSIHMTRPHPYGPAPRVQNGAVFGVTLAAADRRIAEGVITLRAETEKNGFVNGHPMAHHRWLPAINGQGDAHAELIESTAAKFEGGRPWAADVESFRLLDAPTEEMAQLEVKEIIGGYYRQIGVTWNGGRTLAPRV